MRQPMRSDFAHYFAIKVKWGEMDSFGHVNNTVFYRYSEDGRIDYIYAIADDDPGQTRHGPVLAEQRCSFRSQLGFPADVEIGTRVKHIGDSSLELEQCLFFAHTENIIAVYDSVLVWFDFEARTSVRVPATVRARIREIEDALPQK